MPTKKFGFFGDCEVTVDDDGFIEVPVIIQDSGLYGGAPPAELRIVHVGSPLHLDFERQYVARLNRKTDLPYSLATAKIKVLNLGEKLKDEDLHALGLAPLES